MERHPPNTYLGVLIVSGTSGDLVGIPGGGAVETVLFLLWKKLAKNSVWCVSFLSFLYLQNLR